MTKVWILGVIVLILGAGNIYLSNALMVKVQQENNKKTETIQNQWFEYRNDQENIVMQIPANWLAADIPNSANLDLWAVFVPEKPQGKITQFSLTGVSKTEAGQELATQKEFDDWLYKPNQTKRLGNEVKLMNNKVGDTNAITWYNQGVDNASGNYWMIMTWWRKNNKNYYLTTLGKDKESDVEMQLHLNILDRIRFLD